MHNTRPAVGPTVSIRHAWQNPLTDEQDEYWSLLEMTAAGPSSAVSANADLTSFEKEWTQVDKTAAINKVNLLESELFDREERLRRGVTNERAEQLLNEINALRHRLGWLDLDLRHQPVWPHNPERANSLVPAV